MLCLSTPFNSTLRKRSIQNQINYLSNLIDRGYDDQLQRRFPEGKLFSNALLALSTIEYCNKTNKIDPQYSKIVDNCIARIQSKKSVEIFDQNLNPEYGMFYLGWSNLVYSTYLQSDLIAYSEIPDEVFTTSQEITHLLSQIQSDSLQILNTYAESNWPADNLVGILSIKDNRLQRQWTDLILQTSEHNSGLIHHVGGQPQHIRGSSTALITYCLSKMGYKEIRSYNESFHDQLIDKYLGIELVKEYHNGLNNMDVDSGPIIAGYGASATIMNIKTQASLDNPNAKITWAAMNAISLPINICGSKYLILKQEPMLDLFMLWASTEL